MKGRRVRKHEAMIFVISKHDSCSTVNLIFMVVSPISSQKCSAECYVQPRSRFLPGYLIHRFSSFHSSSPELKEEAHCLPHMSRPAELVYSGIVKVSI